MLLALPAVIPPAPKDPFVTTLEYWEKCPAGEGHIVIGGAHYRLIGVVVQHPEEGPTITGAE